jgi:hypothetical protein
MNAPLLRKDQRLTCCGIVVPAGTPSDGITYELGSWRHVGPCPKAPASSGAITDAGPGGFRPASALAAEGPAPRREFPAAPDEERSLLVPVTEAETVSTDPTNFKDEVVQGKSERIFVPLGMPAQWVVCRISRDKNSGRVKAVNFHPMLLGLEWVADKRHKGIVSLETEPVSVAEIEGLKAWEESQNDPRIVFKATVKLGDKRHATGYGTCRASEIVRGKHYQPVVTTSPVEMAETRAISRALRRILSIHAVSMEEITPEMLREAEARSVEPGEDHAALPPGGKAGGEA